MSWPKSDCDHVMVTASQMSKLESLILSNGQSVDGLMEKVGQSMTSFLLTQSHLLQDGVIVLVGPGHNGGDGLVIARELFLLGIDVKIWCPILKRKSLTASHLAHVKWLGVKQMESAPDVFGMNLWIDALFGLGQTRPLPSFISKLFQERQKHCPGRLVSLDVPSGLCSDTGVVFQGGAAYSSITLTVGCIKQGLIQDAACSNIGHIERIDIGFPTHKLEVLEAKLVRRICSSDLAEIPYPSINSAANKYQRGRVLVCAGSKQYPGASLLALRGALASGVGSVQASLPKSLTEGIWQVLPEVVLKSFLDEDLDKQVSLANVLSKTKLDRVDALLVGPGLGHGQEKWSESSRSLENFQGLLVLDADAINRLAIDQKGWTWLKKRLGPTWLTPHKNEFLRLFPQLKNLQPLEAAKAAAEISGAQVLLKGAHTVIAAPDGNAWQLGETAPWVARTGLGDLLAGFATGLGALGIAAKIPPDGELLALAAFLHSEAAKISKADSSPSAIAKSLAALVNEIQIKKCLFHHFD